MAYDRINWENTPSHVTPLSAENLNTMDEAIDNIDEELNRVGVKAVNLEARMDTAETNIVGIGEELTEQDTYAKGMGTKTLQHETDIATLKSQVTQIIDGGPASPSELTDVRISENGTAYPTAGEAVRAQVRQMIEVQDTQPTDPGNKLWINDGSYDSEDHQVPTWEEFSELKNDLSYVGAISVITPVWNNGYIDSSGTIKGTSGNGRYSNKFYVEAGQTILFTGYGYNQAIAMISKVITEGTSYLPLVMCVDSTERTYKYTVTEPGYYAVCVSGLSDGIKAALTYINVNYDDTDPFDTTLTKHDFAVVADTSKTEFFDYSASAGDKLVLKLDIGFFDARTFAWYYTDRGGVNHSIVTTVLYIPYLFEAPEDITGIGVYIGKALIPASATYTISVRKLSVLGVIPNDIYIEPSNGLYTTIKSITDCDRYNPYYIHLAKGTYDVSSEFTQAEIESAEYSADGFAGLCLTDGMYLVGEGEKETVIVSCEISTDYSNTIRNQISTLNTKGDCGAENITFKSNNIRYTVHDDYTHSSYSKHKFKNCDFIHTNGTGSFAYGNGMNSGLSVELENCVFVPSVLSHLSASTVGWSKGSSFVLENCKAENVTIRNNDTKIKCIADFINCEIGTIEYTNSIATQYLTIEGTGTNALFSAPNGTVYAVGDIHKVINNNYVVGMCLDYDKVLTNSNPYWIVVGVDDDYAYLQRSGYISSNILGITAGNVGDYWTCENGYIVTGGTSANAIAKVIAVVNGEAFAQIL